MSLVAARKFLGDFVTRLAECVLRLLRAPMAWARQVSLIWTNKWRQGRLLEALLRHLLLCWPVWAPPWALNVLLFLDIGQAHELVRAFYLEVTQLGLVIVTCAGALSIMLSAWRLDSRLWFISSVIGMSAIPTAPLLVSDLPSYTNILTEMLAESLGVVAAAISVFIVLVGAIFICSPKDRDRTFSLLTWFSVLFLIFFAVAPAGAVNRLPPWLVAAAFLLAWMTVLTGVQAILRRRRKSIGWVQVSSWTESSQSVLHVVLRNSAVALVSLSLAYPVVGWLLVFIAASSASTAGARRFVAQAFVLSVCGLLLFQSYVPTSAPNATLGRISAEEHFLQWIKPRIAEATEHNPYSVVLVTGDGGGLRASYWSYNVLEALYDNAPEFYSHLYAAASISGASLGTASFVSAVMDLRQHHTGQCHRLNNASECLASSRQGPLSFTSERVGPATGGWLSQWVADKLGLTRFSTDDRFEAAVLASTPIGTGKWLQEDLSFFSKTDSPLLILGSTDAQSGRPLVASSAKLPHELRYAGAIDMLDSSQRISLLNAAYHSARFPGVSNPARIENSTGDAWMAVDGGYYDNSAAEIMEAYVHMIDRLSRTHRDLRGKVRLVLVMLTNKPSNDPSQLVNPQHDAGFLGLMQSLSTFEQVRQRRAASAKSHLAATISSLGGVCINIDMGKTDYPIPVGWTLGRTAYNEMARHLVESIVLSSDGPARYVSTLVGSHISFPPTTPPKRPFSCNQPPVPEREFPAT